MTWDAASLGEQSPRGSYQDPPALVVGDLTIDLQGRDVFVDGHPVPLTRIEFDILAYLAAHPGWVVSPDQLMEEVWGYQSVGDTRAVAVHIGNLRRKLGDSATDLRHIQTVRGAGYKLARPAAHPGEGAQEPRSRRVPSPPGIGSAGTPVALEESQAPAADDRFDRSSSSAPSSGMIGRESEISTLLSAWLDAEDGRGGLVLLSGDAGAGKTRLAEELEARVRAHGGMVAWGRCHQARGLPPLWPWLQIVRHVADGSSDVELEADVAGIVEHLVPLIPELRRRAGDHGAVRDPRSRHDREAFFSAVTEYLVRSSRRRGLLLVLDDLHAADQGSLQLLEVLASEMPAAPLLLLAAYRDTDLGPDPLVAVRIGALERGGAHRLHVSGLSAADVGRMMSAAAGTPVSEGLARAVHAHTAGNPLFVLEITRLLAAEDRLTQDDTRPATLPLPLGARGILERRVSNLSPSCRHLVTVAALLGAPVDLLVLEDASGLSGDEFLVPLDEAVAARMLERAPEQDGLRFVHPLMQDVVARGLGEGVRLRTHAHIGETLESHSLADPERALSMLAHHFSKAAPLGYGPRAFDYSVRAGNAALALYGYEEAADHFARAAALLPCSGLDETSRRAQATDLHERAGDALSLAARRSDAAKAYARAAAVVPAEDVVTAARLERKKGAAWLADQEPARAATCFDAADAILDRPGAYDAERILEKIEVGLQRMAAMYYVGDSEGLSSLLRETHHLVEREGTVRQRGIHATHYLGLAFRRERFRISPETLSYAHDNWRRLHASDESALVCESECQLGLAYLCAGQLDQAHRHLRACAEMSRHARDLPHLVRAVTYDAVAHRLGGDVGLAREVALDAVRQATQAHLLGYVAAGKATLGWVSLRSGDTSAAEEQAREALELWRAPSAFPFEWLARWPLASLAVRADRLDEARGHIARMLETDQQSLPDALAVMMTAATRPPLHPAEPSSDEQRRLLESAVRAAHELNYC